MKSRDPLAIWAWAIIFSTATIWNATTSTGMVVAVVVIAVYMITLQEYVNCIM